MNFNGVARIYEPLARLVFGTEHRRAEAFFLPEVPEQSRVLLVGGGAGHLLEMLLQHRRPEAVAFLEPSLAMRRRAANRVARVPGAQRVVFLQKSGELAGHARYDVLMTPFVLDLFPDAQLNTEFLPPLLAALTPEARWLFTDFVQPRTRAQALLVSTMYVFFGLVAGIPARRLPDYAAAFAAASFRKTAVRFFGGGMMESAVLRRFPPGKEEHEAAGHAI